MSRRTVGLTVVLTVIGVAFVLEGWTFMELIVMQFTDQTHEEVTSSGEPSEDLMAAGDVIELDPECNVHIEKMQVHAGTEVWTFRIAVTVENSGSRPLALRSRNVRLTSGKTAALERSVSVPGNGSVTLALSADVPQGTEVTEWRLRWSRTPDEGNWTDRSISLDKAPVRRRNE